MTGVTVNLTRTKTVPMNLVTGSRDDNYTDICVEVYTLETRPTQV